MPVPQESAKMNLTAPPMQAEPPLIDRTAGTPPPPSPADIPEIEIRARRGWVAIDFKELIFYRELLYFLVWRDVKVRYKQTVLGAAWAILQPVLNVIIQTVIFGTVAGFASKLPPELKARHVPYSLFNYAGILPWMLFATGCAGGGMSLMSQQNLLTKIYFPRLFVPAAVIGAGLMDMAISFAVFFVLMACYGVAPPWTVIFVPLLVLMTVLVSAGMAFLFSCLIVTYRDFRFLLPFIVSTWQFCSPVGYPLDPRRQWIRWLLRLNPLYGIINAYRSVLLGQNWDFPALGMAVLETAAVLLFGMYYFKKTERRFADLA
jgi:lipopolysaccharide transport system permease protein